MTSHPTDTDPISPARARASLEAIARLTSSGDESGDTPNPLREQWGREWADRIAAASRLQSRARRKFGDGVWCVTRRALEQATAWQVARLKASWFGTSSVVDLCCGVGGDAMQLARRGSVVAVDWDPVLAEMTWANLFASWSGGPPRVTCRDATEVPIPPDAGIHIDPDRRVGSRKSRSPDQYVPSWNDVRAMVRRADAAVVKLAPAALLGPDQTEDCHSAWISLSGVVRERSVLYGSTISETGMPTGGVSAFRVRADGSWHRYLPTVRAGDATVPAVTRPQRWLIDPDAAIRAAGLTEAFAEEYGLRLVGSPSGFLTCERELAADCPVRDLAVVGAVVWSGTADDRKLRREFRQRRVFPATIKCRGTDHDPALLVKRYRACGDRPVSLWIARGGQRVYAAITDSTPA